MLFDYGNSSVFLFKLNCSKKDYVTISQFKISLYVHFKKKS